MKLSQLIIEKSRAIRIPIISDEIKPGVVGFVVTFVVLSFLNFYVGYVVVKSGSNEEILNREDILLWATIVSLLIMLYLPVSIFMGIIGSESLLFGVLLGNIIVSLAVAIFILFIKSIQNFTIQIFLVIGSGFLLLSLLFNSALASIFVIINLSR